MEDIRALGNHLPGSLSEASIIKPKIPSWLFQKSGIINERAWFNCRLVDLSDFSVSSIFKE